MSDCTFASHESGTLTKYRCQACGFEFSQPVRRNCPGVTSSKGLGDTIAKVTTALGIKPCDGCRKRQEKLNELWPYATDAQREQTPAL